MKVTVTFKNGKSVTMTYKEWIDWGKEKGYCRANKIKIKQITEIQYIQ